MAAVTLETPSAPRHEGYEDETIGITCAFGAVPMGDPSQEQFLVLSMYAAESLDRTTSRLWASAPVAQSLERQGFQHVQVLPYGTRRHLLFYPTPYGGGGLGQSWCAVEDQVHDVWRVHLNRAYCSDSFLDILRKRLGSRPCVFSIDVQDAAHGQLPHRLDVRDMMRGFAGRGAVLFDPSALFQARWSPWGFVPDLTLDDVPFIVEREGLPDRHGQGRVTSTLEARDDRVLLVPANHMFERKAWDKNVAQRGAHPGERYVYLPLGSGQNQLKRLVKWAARFYDTVPRPCV